MKREIKELSDEALLNVLKKTRKYELQSIREVIEELDQRGVKYDRINPNSIALTVAERSMPSLPVRFIEYLIDLIVLYVISFSVGVLVGLLVIPYVPSDSYLGKIIAYLAGAIVNFVYYLVLEGTVGRTIGKMILGLKVVDINGGKASSGSILIRSICRFIPFDPLSFLFNQWKIGPRINGHWHDKISKTYVVSVKKVNA